MILKLYKFPLNPSMDLDTDKIVEVSKQEETTSAKKALSFANCCHKENDADYIDVLHFAIR